MFRINIQIFFLANQRVRLFLFWADTDIFLLPPLPAFTCCPRPLAFPLSLTTLTSLSASSFTFLLVWTDLTVTGLTEVSLFLLFVPLGATFNDSNVSDEFNDDFSADLFNDLFDEFSVDLTVDFSDAFKDNFEDCADDFNDFVDDDEDAFDDDLADDFLDVFLAGFCSTSWSFPLVKAADPSSSSLSSVSFFIFYIVHKITISS